MHHQRRSSLPPLAVSLLFLLCSVAANSAAEPVLRDVEYAKIDEHSLTLDLYLPADPVTEQLPPLIVWVHGGAWRAGSKEKMPLGSLL